MKVSLITPDSMLDMENAGQECFILATRWDSTRYITHYVEQKRMTIVDNGAYELSASMPASVLVHIAQQLKTSDVYVVIPDVLRNARGTRLLFGNTIEVLRRLPYKLMAVPQADTREEWMKEYAFYAKQPHVSAIGLPIWMNRVGYRRSKVLFELQKKGLYARDKMHHLLGLDEPIEVRECVGLAHGVDTSLPFSLAWMGAQLTAAKPPEHTRVPIDAVFTEEKKKIAESNCRELLRLAE